MRKSSVRRFLIGILCVIFLNFSNILIVHSMEEFRKDDNESSLIPIRVSTQIKSSELKKIIWENEDKLAFMYTENIKPIDHYIEGIETFVYTPIEPTYHYIGQINAKDIIKTFNERISLGTIGVPATCSNISLFIYYHGADQDVYSPCFFSSKKIHTSNISLLNDKNETLSAVRLDLDINLTGSAPIRGTIFAAYNKPNPTLTMVSSYTVGGHGILPSLLEIAKNMVDVETNLQIFLGESRESRYITSSSDEASLESKEDSWAPASQIMYTGAMMKKVADLMGMEQLSLDQKEVILSYLVHIHKCDRIGIHQLREDLGIPSRKK